MIKIILNPWNLLNRHKSKNHVCCVRCTRYVWRRKEFQQNWLLSYINTVAHMMAKNCWHIHPLKHNETNALGGISNLTFQVLMLKIMCCQIFFLELIFYCQKMSDEVRANWFYLSPVGTNNKLLLKIHGSSLKNLESIEKLRIVKDSILKYEARYSSCVPWF